MVNIKFGPAGLGGVKEAISNLEKMHELGINACEISFTYGPYIKEAECKKNSLSCWFSGLLDKP